MSGPWSVRIDDDTRELLQNIMNETGETQSEFFKRVALQIQLEQLKENGVDSEEIEELQLHTARINEIMISIVERSISMKNMASQQMWELKSQFEEQINNQAEKITRMTKDKELTDAEMENNSEQCLELEGQLWDTKQSLSQANDLILEYKNKINNLSVLATENQRKASEYDAHILKIKELDTKLDSAETGKMEAEKTAQSTKIDLENHTRKTEEQLSNLTIALDEARSLASEYKSKYEQSESNMKTALREAAANTREEIAKVKEEYLGKMQSFMEELHQLRQEMPDVEK